MEGEGLGHAVAEAAVEEVLLAGDDGAGLAGAGHDGLHVERLDGVDIDNLAADADLFEHLGGLQGFPHEVAAGEEGDVSALAQQLGLADFELLTFRQEAGHLAATEAQIDGPDVLGGGQRGGLGLVEVGGHEHGHVGQHLHQGDVLHGLVRGAVLAERDAGVRAANLDVLVRVAHHLADLVIDAAGDELGEAPDEGHLAAEAQAGGDADHVGLGDAALDEALGEFLGEAVHLDAAFHVGAQGDDILVLAASLYKAFAHTGTQLFA